MITYDHIKAADIFHGHMKNLKYHNNSKNYNIKSMLKLHASNNFHTAQASNYVNTLDLLQFYTNKTHASTKAALTTLHYTKIPNKKALTKTLRLLKQKSFALSIKYSKLHPTKHHVYSSNSEYANTITSTLSNIHIQKEHSSLDNRF